MKELGVQGNGSPRSWEDERSFFPWGKTGLKTYPSPSRRTATMLYIGIDQHAKQLTVSLRDEAGDIRLRRQVSTQPERCLEFLTKLNEKATDEGGYIAIVEVCGFNDWLLDLLPKHGCHQVILIQPTKKPKVKTDRRDAHSLSELLWTNRDQPHQTHSASP